MSQGKSRAPTPQPQPPQGAATSGNLSCWCFCSEQEQSPAKHQAEQGAKPAWLMGKVMLFSGNGKVQAPAKGRPGSLQTGLAFYPQCGSPGAGSMLVPTEILVSLLRMTWRR